MLRRLYRTFELRLQAPQTDAKLDVAPVPKLGVRHVHR
jgi:hypothetical protein